MVRKQPELNNNIDETPDVLTVAIPKGPTYKLKVPTGPLGWKHFRILMEVENERENCPREPVFVPKFGPKLDEKGKPVKDEDGEPVMVQVFDENNKPIMVPLLDENGIQMERILETPALKQAINVAMDNWVEQILPHILIDTEFESIPWHFILPLFQCSSSNTSISNENFRGDQSD